MKKIHVLSVVCLIFFACDTEVNNSTSEPNGTANLSSSLEFTSSSSLEFISSSSSELASSSSSQRNPNIPLCKTFGQIDTLYFNKQGGVNTVDASGTSIRIGGSPAIIKNIYDSKECNFDFESLDPPYPNNTPIKKIECPWFSVEYISKDSVQVSVNKNETGEERSQDIPLTGGGCALGIVGYIKIIQTSAP